MHGERGQNAEIVIHVSIDVVIAIALDCAAAGGVHSSTIPRGHRMRDPENDTTPLRLKSGTVVAGNDIAHHDGGWPIAERRARRDADTRVVGSLATDDRDIERSPERRHDDSAAIIGRRRDVAEYAGEQRSVAAIEIPLLPILETIVFETEKLIGVLDVVIGPNKIPPNGKLRTTQFSMARFPPVLNQMPFVALLGPSMVRPRR
jgi:hypothetical protein